MLPHPVLGDTPVLTRYSDYRRVGNIQFPMRISQSQAGAPAYELAVQDVQPNVAVDITVPDNVRNARENARTFREIIPREAWEEINALYLYARDHANDGVSKRGRQTFVKAVIRGSQTITGLLDGCMSHDEPFLFVQLGKNLERADMTTRIIDVRSATLGVETSGAYQNIQWMSVLKSLSGYQMYRQERQTSVTREPALEFLLRSMRFPRSVSFCVHALRENLATMPDREHAMKAIGELEAMLVDPERRALMRDDLPAFIDHLQLVLGSVHEALVAAYFARNDRMAAA